MAGRASFRRFLWRADGEQHCSKHDGGTQASPQ